MADERDRPSAWLRPAAGSERRPLAASLRSTGAAAGTSWLSRPEPASAPAPVAEAPAVCPRCEELEWLRAELTAEQEAAARRGREEGLAETATLREKLAAAAAAAAGLRQEREAALTETIVDVALGLCEWLAPAAAAIDRRGLAPLVTQALAAGGNRELVLRLNADDAAELGTQVPSGVVCEVVADLAPGEVRVEAPRLVVDASWPTRLAALREPLLALLRAAAPTYELASDEGGDGAPRRTKSSSLAGGP